MKHNKYRGCSASAAGLYYLRLKKQNCGFSGFCSSNKSLIFTLNQHIIANFLLLVIVSFSEIDYTSHYNNVSAAEDTNHKV